VTQRRPISLRAALLRGIVALAILPACASADAIYRWTDADGVIHISSEKPPRGVQAERIEVHGTSSGKSTPSGSGTIKWSGGSSTVARSSASPAQVAEREEVLGNLRNRECVIALESLDRLTSGAQATSGGEIRRLQQTAELNCSKDPARRREQEQMAARLRVANGPTCLEARKRLSELLAPGAQATRDQLKAQQDFVDQHCTAPVR
jgi:hypothetical protein